MRVDLKKSLLIQILTTLEAINTQHLLWRALYCLVKASAKLGPSSAQDCF